MQPAAAAEIQEVVPNEANRIESNQVGIDTKLKGENEFEKIIRAWIRFCGRHTRLEKPISISRSEPTYSTLSYFLFGTGVRDFFYEPINGLACARAC